MTIDMAAEWFTQPWKVGGGTKTLWFARYEAVRDAKIKKLHKAEADAERRKDEYERTKQGLK